ncbi:MAG: DUF349 domain-containing protein [Bacteroidales bacterium]|nr:DUF349 domain-containing protein [Bacteroidales bacterium]
MDEIMHNGTPVPQDEAAEQLTAETTQQPAPIAEQPAEFTDSNPETLSPEPAPRTDPATKQEVIERLKTIVYEGAQADRSELERLKMIYYRLHNAAVAEAREQFIANGGAPEAFMPQPDPEEENFKAQMSLIREMKAKAAEEQEREKQANLQRKQQIIERIKAMAVSPEEADKGYDELKKLQEEWKEIKNVPAENATELWKNYQLYVEQYYDQLRLNHEMRAYDFKKNLEIKTQLCEAAEKLAAMDDVIAAFHQLQTLHQEYRETGPVAKELRDEIWKRFKDASTVVNKRHQQHFEELKAQEEQNLARKTELCEKVETLRTDEARTYQQWDELTQQVLAWQAEWKTIGFTPRKVNNEIFERFRAACDAFFQQKTSYFKDMRETLAANLAAKNSLIAQAEELKDSTDWAATTQKLVELQKQWKQTGPVAHKVSDAVWKRFNDACNAFFNRKAEQNAGQRKEEEANLARKNEILAQLEKLAAEPAADQLQAVRALQAEWQEVGHVPFRKKEKMYRRYRELCDTIYNALHENAGRRHMDNFRRNVAEKEGNELTRERTRLLNALEAKKQEIQNYETNLTFFRASSKKGNSLVADIEKKLARLKEDLALMQQKVKAVNEQINSASQKD